MCWSNSAAALPAYAQQTGQPCSQCHVGAFGPQLKPYGREFKLFGYVNGDKLNTLPSIAVVALISFTHTSSPQTSAPASHFADNDNVALDQLNLLYGGKLFGGAGTFAELTYDGVRRTFTIDNVDIKRAVYLDLGERHAVVGLDLNDSPTVQDLWNSTPTWGFPYNSSALAPTPAARAAIDGDLAQRVVGVGAYTMWNDLLYAEATAYQPIENRVASRLGVDVPTGSDAYNGVIPYWRVALQHQFTGNYLEAGAYGLLASRFPSGVVSDGTDRIADVALDATYQYTAGARNFLSAHATWIHENEQLNASRAPTGSQPSDHLDTLRGDLSYSFNSTWTPSAQLFRTTGSRDAVFFGAPNGANSQGYLIELAYVPFGKVGSPVLWANARFTAQWVGYTEFNGLRKGASANNTLYLSSRFAVAPLGAFVHR